MTTPPCIGPEFFAGPLPAPDKPWTTLQIKNAQPMAWPYDPTALPAGNGLGNDAANGLWVDAASFTAPGYSRAALTYTAGTDPATLSTTPVAATTATDNVLRALDTTWTNPLCEPQQLLVSTMFEVGGQGMQPGQMVSLKAQAGDAAWGALPSSATWPQYADQQSWTNTGYLPSWSLTGRVVRRIVAPASATVTILRRCAVVLTVLDGGSSTAPAWPTRWAATTRFLAMPMPAPTADTW